jgi:HK97 family phage major capsid protein
MGMIEQMHRHIAMPTQPFEVPLQLARLTSYLASEQTASTGQTAVTKSSVAGITGKLTLTAIDLAVEVLCSKHVEEDSIVAILPFLRPEVIKTLARGVEEACINGDTTATHQDSDTHANGATDRRKAWLGFRKLAMANSYSVDFGAAGNGWDFETLMKVRAKHGKYGIVPSDLYWLASLQLFFKLLSLKDSAGNPLVTTIDKAGPRATVVTGVLGFLGGSEIAVSEFCRDDLNANGVYQTSDGGKSAIISVFKPGFVFGDRRDGRIQLLSELYAEYQQDALLSVIRKDFKPLRPIASHAAVAIGYDIALS